MSNKGISVLVTGAGGYIGSHTCLKLLQQGFRVIGVDNLVRGNRNALHRVEEITGNVIPFFETDLRDIEAIKNIFSKHSVDAVIHFAGYKAVGESVEEPLLYYSNNVSASVTLLMAMEEYGIQNIVFSSSCTVYGKPDTVPVKESDGLSPTNPYGQSKLMVERVLRDFFQANDMISVSILRYFNPIGAHPSGMIGEDPKKGTPNNLLPYISRVAAGHLEQLEVFGDDYNTHDGTGVRDYIHVVDLAKAHIIALEKLFNDTGSIFEIYNLGTGVGYSVLDVINAFEEVSGMEIPYKVTTRRPGDVEKTYADPERAKRELGWAAKKGLKEMCRDMWHWQQKNPNGYNN